MRELEAYLPIDRRYAMAQGEAIPEHMTGTLLFADLSGFTPLMESYVEDLGRQRGTEEFSHLLNRFFDVMVEPLHLYKGSIICFIGDAIICWFRDDGGLRAISACLKINEAISPFSNFISPGGRPVSLALKMSVVSGPIRRFVLGDPDIHIMDVIAGRAVDLIAETQEIVKRGEIIIPGEMTERYPEIITGETRYTESADEYIVCKGLTSMIAPDPWPEVPSLKLEFLKPWVLPPVYDRITAGQQDFIIELRVSVVCFLKFSFRDHDQENYDVSILDDFIRKVQHIVHEFEGQVFQITFGDKGNNIFFGFGAPISHEDDIERALNTSLFLMELKRTLPYLDDMEIGMSVGHFRTGPYGGRSRSTYACLGAHANLASRLMSHALPGQILVSQPVMDSARKFEFSPLGTLRIKGFTKPVSIFSLERRRASQAHQLTQDTSKSAGRNKEKAILKKLAEKTKSEPVDQWCIVEGQAGIGKSNLVGWMITLARQLGYAQLVTRAEAIEERTPYHGLLQIIQQIFDLNLSTSDTSALQQKVCDQLAAMEEGLDQWASLLQMILPFNWKESEATSLLTAKEKEPKLRWLLERIIIGQLAKKPLLLIIENAQWLDSSTEEFLLSLRDKKPEHLLVLIVTRHYKDHYDLLNTMPDSTPISHLTLEVLNKEDLDHMLCAYLSIGEINSSVMDILYQKTGGHPLFSRILIDTLLDDGILRINNGICELADKDTDLHHMQLPDSIHSVIINRIDRLPAKDQLALKVASILGELFSLEFLKAVYPVEKEKHELDEILQRLSTTRILAIHEDGDETRYKFEHQIIHQAVYSLVPFELRRRIHLQLVDWIKHTYANQLSSYYHVLGHHAEAAEDFAGSAHYWGKVGEQAIEHGVYKGAEEVILHAQRLLEKLPPTQENLQLRLNLMLTLGSIRLVTHGQSADLTGEVYLRAQEIAEKIEQDVPHKATVLFGLSVHYYMRGAIEKCNTLAGAMLEIGKRLGLVEEQIQAHLMLANCAFWIGDFQTQDKHIKSLLALYPDTAYQGQLAHYAQNPKITVWICHTWSLAFRGEPEAAFRQLGLMHQTADKMEHSFSKGMAMQAEAFLNAFLQQTEAAHASAMQLLQISIDQGFPVFMRMAQVIEGWVMVKNGQHAEGIRQIHEVIDKWQASRATLGLGMFYTILADAYHHAAMWQEGLDMLEKADTHLQQMEERVFYSPLYAMRGRSYSALGQNELAEEWLRKAFDLARQHDNYLFGMYAAMHLAHILQQSGRKDEALQVIDMMYAPGRTAVNQKEIEVLRVQCLS
ncbi:MAG: AAA family ATPase [Saprospiraceae bacterium]|nr:AAA family ATPase [Candidatus Opimibacter iunctus]